MPVLSMADLLESRPKKLVGTDIIVFNKESNGKYVYLTFKIGENVIESAGWKIGDYLNFVIDTDNKKSYLESATATTGRPLTKFHKESSRGVVRFPLLEVLKGLTPEGAYEVANLKVTKGKAKFQL